MPYPSITQQQSLAAMVAYSFLFYHVPLHALTPHHGGHMDVNNLHILGMWANFTLSAYNYYTLAKWLALKNQQQQITKQREVQLQDEQLLAVGTLAAGTAHELGTPLNTIS